MESTKEFIKKVYNIELSCYEQQRYIDSLKQQAAKLSNPSYYALEDEVIVDNFRSSLICGTICGLISAFFIWFDYLYANPDFSFTNCAIWALIGFGAGFFIYVFCSGGIKKDAEARARNKHVNENNKYIEAKNQEIFAKSQAQLELLQLEISHAENALHETQDVLNKFYHSNVIYKKYWGIVPISTFLEYFESGRCQTLPEAYDRYEQDLVLNRILTKFDDIIQCLDKIEGNQYMLAESLRESNQSIQRLSSIASSQTQKLEQITSNQEVADYYNRINAMNTSYLAWETLKNS